MPKSHFDKILDLHKNGFKPAYNLVRLKKRGAQIKLPFEDGHNIYRQAHVQMGVFYELITMGLFGGILFDSIRMPSDLYKGWIKPDVLNKKDKTIYESKACRTGHQLYLLKEQIEKYYTFQILYPNQVIYYAIWRHSFQKIMNCGLETKDLFKTLAGATKAGIILPFSIIVKMSSIDNKDKGIQQYIGNIWGDGTKIGSTFLNQFIFDPQDALKTMELDLSRFKMERIMSPTNFNVESNKIENFPFIIIEDTQYSDWVYEISNKVPF